MRASIVMHRDLIRLRRRDPVFRAQRPRGVDGAVLGPEAFVLRFFGEPARRRRRRRPPARRESRRRPRPRSRAGAPACAARRHALARPVVERRRAPTAGRASRRSRRDTTGAFPATPPSCSSRMPAAGADDPARRRGRGDRGSGDAPGGAPAPGDRLVPVPLRSLTSAGESVREAVGRPRVAGHQRPRRLRRGDGGGRADATLSRAARRRAAHAARAHRSC